MFSKFLLVILVYSVFGVELFAADYLSSRIPRGPKFVEVPKSQVFDLNNRDKVDHVAIRCVASGYPPPEYKWFKRISNSTHSFSEQIDPLKDPRYTLMDGTLIIQSPKAETERGSYYCRASNDYGTIVSGVVSINFGYMSMFTNRRSNDNAVTNWGKTLSCDPPHHHPRGTFFWTKNGLPNIIKDDDSRIFVSNDGNLYFSSIETVDRGHYSCNLQSAISGNGRTGPSFYMEVEPNSNSQLLQFPHGFPKIFPEAPVAGNKVTLECIAYGYPTPTYEWVRVNKSLPQSSSVTSYNRLLIIPSVQLEDSGEYRCIARTSGSQITSSATLRVRSLPTFRKELPDQFVDVDANVNWTCDAFGDPEVSFLWHKNGQVLHQSNLSSEESVRYRINRNNFYIERVNAAWDNGVYQCEAQNELGSTFNSAELRVAGMRPSFAKSPLQDVYAAVGTRLVIPCLPEALPAPRFQWIHNETPLPQVNQNLTISSVRKEDEGYYICNARNKYGADRSQAYVTVFDRPNFLTYPPPTLVARMNQTIDMSCDVHNDPALDTAFIWLHNGIKIDPTKMRKFFFGTRPGSLTVRNITFSEAGNYTCLIKTSVASIASSTEVIVKGPPNSPGGVSVDVTNSTSAIITWSDGADNGAAIIAYRIEARTNHNMTWSIVANHIPYHLIIRDPLRVQTRVFNLSPWSKYEFRVAAFNELGYGLASEPSPSIQTDEDKPFKAPSNVGGGGGKTGTLTITWDPLPPQDWNSPSIRYRVYYKLPTDYDFQTKDVNSSHNGLYVIDVGENFYYTKFIVKVQALNDRGEGPPSRAVEVYSAESMPQVQPSLVKAIAYNSTAMNVSWDPLDLSREKIRGRLIGHRIKYWKYGKDQQTDSLVLLSRGTQNHGLIVGLSPYTEYSVSVMAYNEAGSGPESEPSIARTYKAAPQRAPTNVQVSRLDRDKVRVTWRGVDTSANEEPIVGYKVRYWDSGQKVQSAKEVHLYLDERIDRDLQVIISGLAPEKTYTLRVLAYSSGGDGKMSSPAIEFKISE